MAEQHPVVDRLARAGLVSYGLLYAVLGWLALQLSLGDREGRISKSGAFHQLAEQPLGRIALWLACAGFAALVIWEGTEAFVGKGDESGAKSVLARLRSGFRAVVFAVIGFSAATVALGEGSGGGTDSQTAKLMRMPFGPWLVGAVGVAVLGFAVFSVITGLTDRWRKDIDARGRSGRVGTVLTVLARVGYCARGVAFGIVGSLFVWAAFTQDPKKSGGLDAALGKALQAPLGPTLLAAVALGFVAYGVFNVAKARYLKD